MRGHPLVQKDLDPSILRLFDAIVRRHQRLLFAFGKDRNFTR